MAPLSVSAFHLPGRYVDQADGRRMQGAAYVELWTSEVTRPHPVVMLHGGGQTGLCFTAKPDGGEGWAQAFARQGFAVYVMDEPSRGRSPHNNGFEAAMQPVLSAEMVEKVFTATAHHALWPGAERHSQWPGAGRVGDPVFDRFYASQAPQLRDALAMETAAAAAVGALLDEIGPAILLAHSQGAPRGWRAADARPDLVRTILAVEPMGRPFYWTAELAAVFGIAADTVCHPFGLCAGPIAYDPPAADPAALRDWRAPENHRRRLANLARIPVTVVSAEASYHRASDVEICEFLTAMGVPARLLRLEEIGLAGNGHMMMLERNSDAIALALIRELECGGVGQPLPGTGDQR